MKAESNTSAPREQLIIDQNEGYLRRRLEEAMYVSRPDRRLDPKIVDLNRLAKNIGIYGD